MKKFLGTIYIIIFLMSLLYIGLPIVHDSIYDKQEQIGEEFLPDQNNLLDNSIESIKDNLTNIDSESVINIEDETTTEINKIDLNPRYQFENEIINTQKTVRTDFSNIERTTKSMSVNYERFDWAGVKTDFPDTPSGITIDQNGIVYVLHGSGCYLSKYDLNGNLISEGTLPTASPTSCSQATDIAVNATSYVFIGDTGNDLIHIYSPVLVFVGQFGTPGVGDGQFTDPQNMEFGTNGDLYVLDNKLVASCDRIQRFSADSNWGYHSKKTVASSCLTNWYQGFTLDNDDNIWITKFAVSFSYLIKCDEDFGGCLTYTYQGFSSAQTISDIEFTTDYLWMYVENSYWQVWDMSTAIWYTDYTPTPPTYTVGIDSDANGGYKYLKRMSSVQFLDGTEYLAGISLNGYMKVHRLITERGFVDNFNDLNIGDDNEYATTEFSSPGVLFSRTSVEFIAYDLGTPDYVGINYTYQSKLGGSIYSLFNSSLYNETILDLSSSATYEGGELFFSIDFIFSRDTIRFDAKILDTGTGTFVTTTQSVSNSYNNLPNKIIVGFDYVWTESLPITAHYRVLTTYRGDNIFESELRIENFYARTNITIYAPLDWSYSRIIPSASIDIVGDNIIIYNTLPLTYSIFFLSGSGFGRDYTRQKQILAIKDITSDYLLDGGFENDWNQDFFQRASPRDFEQINLNYTVVNSGVSSLQLVDSDSSNSHQLLKNLDNGDYYFSFNYYVESWNSGTFDISIWNEEDVTFDANILETTIKNRWVSFNIYFSIYGSTSVDYNEVNFIINFSTGTGTVFIDDFKFNKVSTVIETSGSSETTIRSTFNYWTSYGLFNAINENTTLQLRDITANTIIDSYSAYTDSNGNIYWTWRGEFETKEYELRSIAWNSWWGTQNDAKDWSDLTETDKWSGTINLSPDAKTGKYSINYPDATSFIINTDNSLGLDAGSESDIDYWVYWVKINYTLLSGQNFYLYSSGTTYRWVWQGDILDIPSANTWTFAVLDMDWTTLVKNDPLDFSNLDNIRFNFDTTANTPTNIFIDGLRPLQSQKYYFTPQTVSFIDYAENELENSWDWETAYVVDNAGEVEYYLDVILDEMDFSEDNEGLIAETYTNVGGIISATGTSYLDFNPLMSAQISFRVYEVFEIKAKSLVAQTFFGIGTTVHGETCQNRAIPYTFPADTWVTIRLNLTTLFTTYACNQADTEYFNSYQESQRFQGWWISPEAGGNTVSVDYIKIFGTTDYATHVKTDTYDFGDSLEYFFSNLQNVSDFNDGSLEDWILDNYGLLSNEGSEYLKLVSEVAEYFENTLGNVATFDDGTLEGFTDELLSNYFYNILSNEADFKDGTLESFTDEFLSNYFYNILSNEADFKDGTTESFTDEYLYEFFREVLLNISDFEDGTTENFTDTNMVDYFRGILSNASDFNDGTTEDFDCVSFSCTSNLNSEYLQVEDQKKDYFTEIYSDRIDFKEDTEGWFDPGGGSESHVGSEYLEFDGSVMGNVIDSPASYSISASTYKFLSFRFNSTNTITYITIVDYQYAGTYTTVVCEQSGTWGANVWNIFSCNLELDPDWTGTETTLSFIFNGATSTFFIDWIILGEKDSNNFTRTGLSIDSNKFKDFKMSFNNSESIDDIIMYDASLNIICTDSTGWSASASFYTFNCGLTNWSGTETTLTIMFNGTTGNAGIILINYIEIWNIESIGWGTGGNGAFIDFDNNGVKRSGLSIDSSVYDFLRFDFSSNTQTITTIKIYDFEYTGGTQTPICTDSTGWTANTLHTFSCDLGLSGSWSGTETALSVWFIGTVSTKSIFDFELLRSSSSTTNEGNEYIKFTSEGIKRTGLSINSDTYEFLQFTFNSSTAVTSIEIYDLLYIGESATPICTNSTGWSAGASFNTVTCDLGLSGSWSGTETDLSIIFTGTVGTKFIDYVEVWKNITVTNEGNEYIKFTSEGIKRTGLSINSDTYEFLQFTFNSSTAVTSIEIYDLLYIGESATPICTNSTGWSAGASFNTVTCDLGLSGSWSGTETDLSIIFVGSVGTKFIDYVEVWKNVTVTNPDNNHIRFDATGLTEGGIKRDGLSIDTSTYKKILFRFKSTTSITKITIYNKLYIGESTYNVYTDSTGWSADTYYTVFFDLSANPNWNNTATALSLIFEGAGVVLIDYIELFADNAMSIGQSSLSIDSSVYDNFVMEFNTTHVIESVIIYDGSNAICQDNSIGSSGDYWYLLNCDLSSNSSWTGTETALNISFTYAGTTHIGQTVFINAIYLYNTSLGDRENIAFDTGDSGYSYVRPEGVLYGFHGWESATRENFFQFSDSNTYIPSTTIFETKIRIYETPNPATSYNIYFQIYDNSFVYQGDSDIFSTISENDGWKTLIYDLSQDSTYSTISVVGQPRLFVATTSSKFEMDYVLWSYNPSPNLDSESFYETGGRDLINIDGQLIVEQDLATDSDNIYLSRAVTNLDTGFYNQFQIRIKNNALNAEYQLRIEDQSSNILSSWKIFSNISFFYLEFDFSSNNNWTSSITIIKIHISLSSGTASYDDIFYVDFVGIIYKDMNIGLGHTWLFDENGHSDGWIINGEGSNLQITNGILSVVVTDQFDGIAFRDIETDWNNYGNILLFEAKFTATQLFQFALIDGSNEYLEYTLTTEYQLFEVNLTNFESQSNYVWFGEKSGDFVSGTLFIKYLRIINQNIHPALNEADSYFVLENMDQFQYNIWSDNVSLGVYQTNQPIPKDQAYGFHTIRYQIFNRITLLGSSVTGFYLPGTIYEYNYENYQIYSATVNTFISSDFFLSIFYTANKPTDYIVYENNTLITSGNSDGSGQSVEWDKNVDVGLVLVGIKFTVSNNASEFLWFNTSYGNELVITITSFSTYTNNTHVIIEYTSSTTSISINITEDGISKDSFSNSPITYAKSNTPGQHFVSVLFIKQFFTSVTFSFAYTTTNFFISNLQFYTTTTDVHLDWTAISTGSRDYFTIEENDPIDFSEDSDFLDASNYLIASSIGNGFLETTVRSTIGEYIYLRWGSSFSIDADSYKTLNFRFKMNTTIGNTGGDEISIYDGYWGNFVGGIELGSIIADTWYIVSLTLSDDTDWTGIEDRLQILYTDNTYTNFANTAYVNITFDYIQILKDDVQVEIFEDGTSKGVFSTNANYSIATIPGNHFISAIFFSPLHNNLTFGFFYTINNFVIETLNFYTVTDFVSITWITSLSGVGVQLYEDGISEGTFSTSPSNYAKNNTEGFHYVTAIFYLVGHNNISRSYSYETKPIQITKADFYTNNTYVNLDWTAISDASREYAVLNVNDAWDFNEGDKDGWNLTINSPIVSVVDNNIEFISDGSSEGIRYFDEFVFDYNNSFLEIKIKANQTETITLCLDTEFLTYTYCVYPILSTTFNVFTYDLSTVIMDSDGIHFYLFNSNANVKTTVDYIKILTPDVQVELIENGLIKGNYSTSPSNFPKNTIEGNYFVTAIFYLSGFSNISYTFSYETKPIQITKADFYTNQSSVNFGWSAVSDGSRDYATIELNDPTDFSEDEEGYTKDANIVSIIASGGYLNITPASSVPYGFIFAGLSSFPNSSYNIFTIRIKPNLANEVKIYPKTAGGGFYNPKTTSITLTTTDWISLSWDMSNNLDWELDHSFILDFRVDNGADVSPADMFILLDYVFIEKPDVQIELIEDGISKGGFSESISSYNINDNQGLHLVTVIFYLDGFSNISYNFQYTVSQFVITSQVFYKNATHIFLEWTADQSNVNITIKEDGILKQSSTNVSSLTLSQRDSEGSHFLALTYSKPGHNSISNLETYEVDPIQFTNFLWSLNATHIQVEFNLTRVVDIKVYRDYTSYANFTSTEGEIMNVTKLTSKGDHIIILNFNRTGYNLVSRILQYNIQIAPLIDEDIIVLDINQTSYTLVDDTTQEAVNAIIILSVLMTSAVGLSVLFVYLYNRNREEFRNFAKNLPEDVQKVIDERRNRPKRTSNRFARSSSRNGDIERLTPFK